MKVDQKLVEALYRPYLAALEEQKKLLETEFGITDLVKAHPAWSQEEESCSRLEKIKKLMRDLWKGSVKKSVKNLIVRIDLNLRYKVNHKKDVMEI